MPDQFVVISRTTGKPISHRVSRAIADEIAATWDCPVVPDALTVRLWQRDPGHAWTVAVQDAHGVGYLQAQFDRAWAAELFARTLARQFRADGAIDVTVERHAGEGRPLAPMLSQTDRHRSP